MKIERMKPAIFFVLLLFLKGNCLAQAGYYVSPAGNDRNTGTREKPFKTIGKAQQAVRAALAAGPKEDITVWLGGGTYWLTESLQFGPEDSGPEGFEVRYQAVAGEKPVISGGKQIRNWKKSPEGLWVAPIDRKFLPDFRELFIDGKRAVRARHPNADYLRVAAVGEDRRTNFRFNAGDFPAPANPREVEVVMLHDWSVSRIPLADIDYQQRKITAVDSIGAKCLAFFNLDNWEQHPRYFLENSKAFLDAPGEWFFDSRAGLLYLMLPEGAAPSASEIIVPAAGPHLLTITGTEQQKVKNMVFRGVSFRHCSWLLPERGYAGIQACHFDLRPARSGWAVVPAAVDVKWAENCTFANCTFQHLGGSGVWLGAGCRGCAVTGSLLEDISGNGVMVGEGSDRLVEGRVWWKAAPQQVAANNAVSGNRVTECGKQFFGAVGIWCGLTAGSQITANQVCRLPYTGISVGWEWSPAPTPCRENLLKGNHIHHIMEVLSDGGGIYMLGLQPGSVIEGNLIHDVKVNAGRAESNGMFLDEGTTEVIVVGNVIYRIAKSPLRFHKATVNWVKDNTLSCGEGTPPVRYNNTPEENIRLENNLILQDDNPEHRQLLEKAEETWKKSYGGLP